MAAVEETMGRGAPFELALIDYMMPGMDGFELARNILQYGQCGVKAAIMLTSAGERVSPARLNEVGISNYLLKPIKKSDLYDAISTSIGACLRTGTLNTAR